jgi:hypothetical protein
MPTMINAVKLERVVPAARISEHYTLSVRVRRSTSPWRK